MAAIDGLYPPSIYGRMSALDRRASTKAVSTSGPPSSSCSVKNFSKKLLKKLIPSCFRSASADDADNALAVPIKVVVGSLASSASITSGASDASTLSGTSALSSAYLTSVTPGASGASLTSGASGASAPSDASAHASTSALSGASGASEAYVTSVTSGASAFADASGASVASAPSRTSSGLEYPTSANSSAFAEFSAAVDVPNDPGFIARNGELALVEHSGDSGCLGSSASPYGFAASRGSLVPCSCAPGSSVLVSDICYPDLTQHISLGSASSLSSVASNVAVIGLVNTARRSLSAFVARPSKIPLYIKSTLRSGGSLVRRDEDVRFQLPDVTPRRRLNLSMEVERRFKHSSQKLVVRPTVLRARPQDDDRKFDVPDVEPKRRLDLSLETGRGPKRPVAQHVKKILPAKRPEKGHTLRETGVFGPVDNNLSPSNKDKLIMTGANLVSGAYSSQEECSEVGSLVRRPKRRWIRSEGSWDLH